ncbi:hypothetical protein Ciccas_003360 [Cichlidogyrus casuarinus]|uniref:Uncharacterized protein n=1 Tax=Cichlidogyrus casuarinus TaxID=1844966 RepID=A0ABD2QES1_9PLAT
MLLPDFKSKIVFWLGFQPNDFEPRFELVENIMSIDGFHKNSTRNHLQTINLNELSLKKSSSYQNLKSTFSKNRLTKCSQQVSVDATSKMPMNSFYRKRNSTQNLSSFAENTQNSSFSRLSQEMASGEVEQGFMEIDQMQLNANRISVNSDLLSRVEKEKREYENRISDLTQLTESRKMEIEKLTFELRNCREEMQKATKLASSAILEANELRSQMELAGMAPEALRTFQVDDRTLTSFKDCNSILENTGSISHSQSESGTTNTNQMTRENAGLTNLSSLSSDWNDLNRLVSIYASDFGNPGPANVANLQGKLQQMEEDNYTTNEELQATMQELGDLQRSLDEAQESNRSLAFEREILLESLCTQTTKLEHCRLQISQLKQLLLTNREAQTVGTREAHFCEIFASIDQEKQALLAQNSDLAQSSDSLAQECRNLNEKLALLQSKYEALEAQHTSLATALAGEVIKSQSSEEDQGLTINHGVEWLANLKQQTEQVVEQVRSEMGQRILTMQEEMDSLKDQLDLARVEHEREATEWKLYERDLLKTVRVADGIKTEVEEELRRLATENHTLRDQVCCSLRYHLFHMHFLTVLYAWHV